MQLTSIEWLWEEIDNLIPYEGIATSQIFNELLHKSKEMHKKEHGDTWDAALLQGSKRAGNFMRAYEDFDKYYQETFVSKGSDEHIVDTNEMIQLPQQETLYTEEQMNSFNERWAFSREQTRHISHRIGFGEGVRLGIAYSEEYYNQLEKTDKDEEDFESDYIDELYESLKQPKK